MSLPARDIVDILLEKNKGAAWNSSHGVYADLSDWQRPKFYAKCSNKKCGHVHGFYPTLADAILKKQCPACDFEAVEKMKKTVHKSTQPVRYKPGQKRKLPWPLSAVKESEDLDWEPDPQDPDDSLAALKDLKALYWCVILRLNNSSYYLNVLGKIEHRPHWSRKEYRMSREEAEKAASEGEQRYGYSRQRITILPAQDQSQMPPRPSWGDPAGVAEALLEAEDLDWELDPQDPDDSLTAIKDLKGLYWCVILRRDDCSYYLNAPHHARKEYRMSRKDAEQAATEAEQRLGYSRERIEIVPAKDQSPMPPTPNWGDLAGVAETLLEAEDLDWEPDPNDPDDSTSIAKDLLRQTENYTAVRSKRGVRITARHNTVPKSRVVSKDIWRQLEGMSDGAFDGSVCLELGIGLYRR